MAIARPILKQIGQTALMSSLTDSLCPSLVRGVLRYEAAERDWWSAYCAWRLEADRRGRLALGAQWKRDEFGRLVPTSPEVAQRTQAGKVGEAKKRGVHQYLHRVEGLPVALNIDPPPQPPGAVLINGVAADDVEMLAAARFVNRMSRSTGASEAVPPPYARIVATAAGADLDVDQSFLRKWYEEQRSIPKPPVTFPQSEEHKRFVAELPVRKVYEQLTAPLLFDPLTLIYAMQSPIPTPPELRVYLTKPVGGKPRHPSTAELESLRQERDRHVQDIAATVVNLILALRALEQALEPIRSAVMAAEIDEAPLLQWTRHDRFIVADGCAIRGLQTLVKELVRIATSHWQCPVWQMCDLQQTPALPADFRVQVLNSVHQSWLDASVGGAGGWADLPTPADLQAIGLAIRAEEKRVLRVFSMAPQQVVYAGGKTVVKYEPATRTVWIGEESHKITKTGADEFFHQVIKANGAYVTDRHTEGEGARPWYREKKRLPKAVQELIEGQPGMGFRMRGYSKLL